MFKFLKKKKKDRNEEIKELLAGYELPSFPSAVMNVLSLLRNPDSSMEEIARAIQVDPGMNVKVLRTVNSAAYGLASKVSSVERAVTLLGKSRLEAIVLSLAVKDTMPKVDVTCYDHRLFWLNSAKRATTARIIAAELHPQTQAESFICGLLQDMAVPVLLKIKGQTYCDLLSRWYSDRSVDLPALEDEAFGCDHQSIGAFMAKEWELPEYLVNSIEGHHGNNDQFQVEPAVRIASLIRGANVEEDIDAIVRECQEKYSLTENRVRSLIDEAFKDAEEFNNLLR